MSGYVSYRGKPQRKMEDGIWKMGKKNILEYFDTKNKKLHDNTIVRQAAMEDV